MMGTLSEFVQDVRFGFRLLRRRPGFSATAIVTLALGIGVNVAMFSVVNAVLIRRLPFPSPDQLVKVGEATPADPTLHAFNPGNYMDVRRETTDAFAALGAFRRQAAVTLTSDGVEAVKVAAVIVRPEFFDVLGVAPAQGRLLTQADVDADSGSIVISSEFWHARLGGDPHVLGRRLELDGHDRSDEGRRHERHG